MGWGARRRGGGCSRGEVHGGGGEEGRAANAAGRLAARQGGRGVCVWGGHPLSHAECGLHAHGSSTQTGHAPRPCSAGGLSTQSAGAVRKGMYARTTVRSAMAASRPPCSPVLGNVLVARDRQKVDTVDVAPAARSQGETSALSCRRPRAHMLVDALRRRRSRRRQRNCGGRATRGARQSVQRAGLQHGLPLVREGGNASW